MGEHQRPEPEQPKWTKDKVVRFLKAFVFMWALVMLFVVLPLVIISYFVTKLLHKH